MSTNRLKDKEQITCFATKCSTLAAAAAATRRCFALHACYVHNTHAFMLTTCTRAHARIHNAHNTDKHKCIVHMHAHEGSHAPDVNTRTLSECNRIQIVAPRSRRIHMHMSHTYTCLCVYRFIYHTCSESLSVYAYNECMCMPTCIHAYENETYMHK